MARRKRVNLNHPQRCAELQTLLATYNGPIQRLPDGPNDVGGLAQWSQQRIGANTDDRTRIKETAKRRTLGIHNPRNKHGGKRESIGSGEDCPKCGNKMGRFEHGKTWQPRANQPYYFKYWDRCVPCGHIQHYECAKTFVTPNDYVRSKVYDQLRPAYVASGDRPPWED